MRNMSPDVISLGEPMVEFCATDTGRLSKVPLFKRGWGGDTSNFAVSAARQGLNVAHICRLGGDEFGRSFLELWEEEGMDNSRVIVEQDAWTAIYIISLMEGGGHDFTYYRAGSAASRYCADDLDLEYMSKTKFFHTSGISLAISKTVREAALKAQTHVRENGGFNSFDINMRTKLWDLETARMSLAEAFKISEVVFASMEDMNTLYGINEPEKAAEHLRDMGVETVVVKHGGKGCYVSTDERSFTMPGYKIDVVDTTGSGDAFDGAWIKGVEMGWELERIASYSNAVGALTATGLGAVAPIPRYDEALRLIKEQDGIW
jgi:2-dehydro-3-deoxygluconokinase